MLKLSLSLTLSCLVLIACSGGGSSGPPGPTGPAGPPGLDGLIATVFEVEVDFIAANGYEALVEIPLEIEVFDTDVIVCYVLDGVDGDVDIWEPLPQLLFFGADTLLYGFNYTFGDVVFFLDGTVDPAGLDPSFTTGLIFRVAIIPADFAQPLAAASKAEAMAALQGKGVTRLD